MAAIGTGALHCGEVLVLFDQHQERLVALRIGTVVTNGSRGTIVESQAVRALADIFPE